MLTASSVSNQIAHHTCAALLHRVWQSNFAHSTKAMFLYVTPAVESELNSGNPLLFIKKRLEKSEAF